MSPYIDIVLFARSPILGKVKKRLAVQTGEQVALAVYRKMLRHALRVIVEVGQADSSLRPVLSHLGRRPFADIPSAFNGRSVFQASLDFSSNLAEEVRSPKEGDRTGVVVLGVDHPTIGAGHIIEMARLLKSYPVAVGPTEDGGFWSIATSVPLNNVIAKLPLGTDRAKDTLLKILAELDLPCGIGPTLWDVDNAQDLARWKKILQIESPPSGDAIPDSN
ncbi:MAG: DUF2064 domain-containing protein [Proteobacteria bacterium]|nr:DUF2064 domain-containing protein [Pseudomonadota bacterium]